MNNRQFNPEELQCIGHFTNVGTLYGVPYEEQVDGRRFNTPITPKENHKIYYEHKQPYWMPISLYDCTYIYPLVVPDCESWEPTGGLDSFGVEWVAADPAPMVKPGNPLLKDIAEWESLKWPDVDSWDWESSEKLYANLCDDRLKRGIILNGMFERMIALMDFENAAIALIENPEAVEQFLDKLTEYNIAILERYKKHYNVDEVVFHDDWGTQIAPFFSRDTVRTVFLPRLKKIADRAHELGVIFTLHSCGNVSPYIPEMIEAGVDQWQLQENANPGLLDLIKTYGDKILFEGYNMLDPAFTEEEVKALIEEHCATYKGVYSFAYYFEDFAFIIEERGYNTRNLAYTKAREAANP